mmetsp:Transcript_53970/g.122849  ORF Transcript_53970/g.122849 Transcript_53970/m.122849 type:complete len:207 (+) Transcript_53970:775-1395(+)
MDPDANRPRLFHSTFTDRNNAFVANESNKCCPASEDNPTCRSLSSCRQHPGGAVVHSRKDDPRLTGLDAADGAPELRKALVQSSNSPWMKSNGLSCKFKVCRTMLLRVADINCVAAEALMLLRPRSSCLRVQFTSRDRAKDSQLCCPAALSCKSIDSRLELSTSASATIATPESSNSHRANFRVRNPSLLTTTGTGRCKQSCPRRV